MGTTAREAVYAYIQARRNTGELNRRTVSQRRQILLRFADFYGDRPLEKLREKHLVEWLATRQNLAPSSLRVELSAVKLWLTWCARRGWCPAGVCDGIRGPRQPVTIPRALPPADIAAALDACPTLRDKIIVLLMVQSGLRCCEVARLMIDDVDLRGRVAVIQGKGNRQRIAPLPEELAEALSEYLARYPVRAGGFVVRNLNDERLGLTAGYISSRVRRIFYEAGIKYRPGDGRSAHALRHSAACDVAAQPGVDIRDVAEFLGHANLANTAIYTRRVRAAERLNRVAEGRTYGRTA